MNADKARRLEQWAAQQFKSGAGGYAGACDLPDSPISAKVLSMAGQGLRRLPLGDFLYLCDATSRADLLRTLADQIDGGETPAATIARISRNALFTASHVAEHIEDAEADGVYTAAETHETVQHTAELVRVAQGLHDRALSLKPGPIKRGER